MHLVLMPDALPAGIEIFRLDLDLQSDAQQALRHLTSEERIRAWRFVRLADYLRFAQTRAAVRCLLARRLGCSPCEVPLSLESHGKPFVDDQPQQGAPLFNVSHSGSHALIALAEPCGVMQLGVDIEQQRSDLDADVMLDIVCTDQERDSVRGAPDVLSAFYQRWVGKEAVLKAIGVGVTDHLRSIAISPQSDGRLAIASEVPEWNGFQAMALPAPSGYAAAVAWRTKEST